MRWSSISCEYYHGLTSFSHTMPKTRGLSKITAETIFSGLKVHNPCHHIIIICDSIITNNFFHIFLFSKKSQEKIWLFYTKEAVHCVCLKPPTSMYLIRHKLVYSSLLFKNIQKYYPTNFSGSKLLNMHNIHSWY